MTAGVITLDLTYGIFTTDPRDHMVDEILRDDFYSLELKPTFDRVPAGSACLDVGAHVGLYTGYLASKGCRVYACEAHPTYLPHLRANVARNFWRHQVTICPVFCYRQPTILCEREEGGTPASNTWLPVADQEATGVYARAVRLDDLFFPEPIRFLKIDAQGADLQVLRGAEALIARDRPEILLEYEPTLVGLHGDSAETYREWIAAHDYVEDSINGNNARLYPKERP